MIIDKILAIRISTVETFGYLIVFLTTLLEASPLVGIFIPGSIILFFAGFAAKMHLISFKLIVFFGVAGAFIGDIAGYLFGRYYGRSFLHRFGKYFLVRKEYIEKSCEIIHEHTGKSLVAGRLNPITRSVAPLIVGSNRVGFWKFVFFNAIGATLWGFTFVSLGYIFGNSYQFAVDYEKYIIISTVVLILAYYLYYFVRVFLDKANGGKECIS